MLVIILGFMAVSIIFFKALSGRWINTYITLVTPYAVIIVGNKLFGEAKGFFAISNDTYSMLLIGFFSFFVGSFLFNIGVSKKANKSTSLPACNSLQNYNLTKMAHFCNLLNCAGFLQLGLFMLQHGSLLKMSSYEGYMLRGPLGHILLLAFPLQPILFYAWIENKTKISYIVPVAIYMGFLFCSFVKYHIISFMVVLYLFVVIENEKYLKKATILIVLGTVVMFVSNYILDFFSHNVLGNVSTSFYFNHLWNYVAGSLITDNRIFIESIRAGYSSFYKLGTFLFGFPNMFLRAIFGMAAFPHIKLAHEYVGTNGELGNVVDAIGYLYPSHGGIVDIVEFSIILILLGVVFETIYYFSINKPGQCHISLAIFMTFFVFFSFFGTFYISATPWEILLDSFFITKLFDKRVKIRIGFIRL